MALSERRGRITSAHSSEFTALLETLGILVDEATPSRALGRVLDLVCAERLTAYLGLAMRLGIPLASKYADLCDDAERLSVSVLRAP